MRKILQILALPLAVVAFIAAGGSTASAQQSCTDILISNTGAGSVNSINCNGNYTVTIECQNDTQIILDVVQDGTSGTATVNDNTNAGGAQTGSVINTSEIDTLVENSNCLAEETPVTPETPEVPEEETPQVQGATVEELPNTGGTSVLSIALISIGAIIGLMIVSRVASRLYSRSQK